MSKTIQYTRDEAVLLRKAGIIAGVLGVISAVSPAISIAEDGVDWSNLTSLFISFFAFFPFTVICLIHLGRYWSEDNHNSASSRLFVLSVCGLAFALFLFVILWFVGPQAVGVATIAIAVIVAWRLWPSLSTKPDIT